MTEALQINLDVPIRSVGMVEETGGGSSSRAASKKLEMELKRQSERVMALCSAMETASRGLEAFYGEAVCSQAECIARLSVNIAEKILLREIASGNYDIAKIVAEALKAAPAQQDAVVRLNPQDLEQYTQMAESNQIKPLCGVTLTADSAVGRAECVVATDQGAVEYFMKEHLRRIGEALEALQ